MKPTFNDLLDAPEENPMTTTHMNYMMNPLAMLLNKIIDKVLPFLDKYDFDAAKLNNMIGFWGSKFAIGIYLGIFVGLLSHQTPQQIFTLAFTAATCLELFSMIGAWFIAAVEPLSQGITEFANNSKWLKGRTLNVGLDWPFIAGRAEVWAAANILAPIMLGEALLLANVPFPFSPTGTLNGRSRSAASSLWALRRPCSSSPAVASSAWSLWAPCSCLSSSQVAPLLPASSLQPLSLSARSPQVLPA